jgi:hypothetical protein
MRHSAVFTDSSAAAGFLQARSTVLGLMWSPRAVSRPPGLETHGKDAVLHRA